MRLSRAWLFSAWLTLSGSAAAGTNAAATAEQSRQVTVALARVAQVEQLLAEAETRVQQLEEVIRAQGQSQASRLENIDQVNSEVSRLRGELEVMSFELAQVKESFSGFELNATRKQLHADARLRQIEAFLKIQPPPPPTDEELGLDAEGETVEPAADGGDGGSDETDTDSEDRQTPDVAFPEDVAGKLAAAREHLAEGRPAIARVLLERALEEHSESDEVAELRYLVGESWFAESAWPKAASVYRSVLQEHSTTDWAAWSMLRVGDCFAELGKADNARLFYEGVIDSYVRSDAAKEAKKRLAK